MPPFVICSLFDFIETLNDIKEGDYIVHMIHGIGIFKGLSKQTVDNEEKDYLTLEYAHGDKLHIPAEQINMLCRYRGSGNVLPSLSKMGGNDWNATKSRVKKSVEEVARDLINLYALRKLSKGFAFEPDTIWQYELEEAFPYTETPDQMKAINETKADMELERPMDRLICGDVGFGKTEVALRAIFKAVMSSKQAAVVVPTTILALQHYQTISERFKPYPVRVELLSRFKSAKEQKEVLRKMATGDCDVVIGTHRLLQKDVEFKDLGLLIIDEEQKFGVSAKERLRELKVEVDTLTLTATPIPRTLQFSLLGARDLSIINTPPPNRLPVQTEIIDFNHEYIRQAVENELNRGGQLFFVHNRVEDILSVEQMLNKICPNARTVVGHGKMEPKLLENRILDFIRGDYDILICTTIIENGIDIPNANTIIINQAQKFGLSDLHQLRGRVGRSNVKAFCYLIIPPVTSITDDAKRRIKAIEAFSELGSGFNIAMQDLEIRGAGNLLGGQQSGFIADMGFETYQRILNEAFVEINEEVVGKQLPKNIPFVSDVLVDTDLELFIPEDYVSQPQMRIKLYKELDNISDNEQIKDFLDGLQDRYGKIPKEVLELINIVKIRRLAKKIGFEKIVIKQKTMLLYFVSNTSSAYYRSEVFAGVIDWIKGRNDCQWREDGSKSWIKIPMVVSVEGGYNILKSLYMSIFAQSAE